MDVFPQKPASPTAEAALRSYEYVCLAALLVMLLVLIERDLGLWSTLPVLIGIGGIAGRWRFALPLLLLFLTFAMTNPWREGLFRATDDLDPIGDLLLSGAVLAYAAGQGRLQGLARLPLPDDPRLQTKGRKAPPPRGSRRPLVEGEIVLLAISVSLCAGLAPFIWVSLPDDFRNLGVAPSEWRNLGLAPRYWRLIALAWLLGVGWLLRSAVKASLRPRTLEEAAMLLQDIHWRETRGEQRRLHRWLTWARLRHERRKERRG